MVLREPGNQETLKGVGEDTLGSGRASERKIRSNGNWKKNGGGNAKVLLRGYRTGPM